MKKYIFLTALAVSSLASCKKDIVDPTPPVEGTWLLITSTTITTPAGGGAPLTNVRSIYPNSRALVFASDGTLQFTIMASASPTGNPYVLKGTYSLNQSVLTVAFPGSYGGAPPLVSTSTVLTDRAMTLVTANQTSAGTEITTDTYTR